MANINFLYDVRISKGSWIFGDGFLGEHMPNINGMVITSKHFDTLAECEKAFVGLMSVLSASSSMTIKQNQVIVTKTNPMLIEGAAITPEENWDDSSILRAFIANADDLKEKKLSYSVMGQIRMSNDGVGASQETISSLTH